MRTMLNPPTQEELTSFQNLRKTMKEALTHNEQFYAEIDVSKDAGFSVMIFHVQKDWTHKELRKPPPANVVRPIICRTRPLYQLPER